MFGWLRGHLTDAPSASTSSGRPVDIGPADLARSLSDPEPPLLLDVRTPAEYASGHIPQARLLPLAELGSRLDELPRHRPIVCVCHSGSRSGAATRLLRARGYQAQNLAGGMLNWQGAAATGHGRNL